MTYKLEIKMSSILYLFWRHVECVDQVVGQRFLVPRRGLRQLVPYIEVVKENSKRERKRKRERVRNQSIASCGDHHCNMIKQTNRRAIIQTDIETGTNRN